MIIKCVNKAFYLLVVQMFLCQCIFAMGQVEDVNSSIIEQIALGGDVSIPSYDFDFLNDSCLGELNEIEKRDLPPISDLNLMLAAQTLSDGIKQPMWQDTKAPAGRDILYHIPYKIAAIEYGGIAGNIFFNMTNRMHASAGSIFGQLSGEPLDSLEQVFNLLLGQLIGEEYQDDLSSLIPLLGEITIQERKFGALVQGGFVKGPFTVQLHTSLQMAERNFWISKKRQREIADMFANYDFGGEFDESELYKIRFGMGDTRLKLGMNTVNMTDFQNDFGFEFIIPTSMLSHSPTVVADPTRIFDDITSNEAIQKGCVDVLKGIRDYLVDPTLGNGGHFGYGCYMESKLDLFHRLMQLWIRASYDKLLEGDEDRLFLYKKTMTPDNLREAVDTGDVDVVRPVLTKFLQQYLLPSSFKCEVYPGGIFNLVLAASTEIKKMKFALGYDYFVQQREVIRKIYNTSVSFLDLRIEDTEADRIEQHKIFAEALYNKKYKRCDMGFGLGGDTAISSHGIGDDWTVYFKIAASF